MILKINNFGPVRGKQDYFIDLTKDLTIVTGGNGLGKTYLGYIVYGIIKLLTESTSRLRGKKYTSKVRINELISTGETIIEINKLHFQTFIKAYTDSYCENIHFHMGIDRKSADMIFKDLTIEVESIESVFNVFLKKKMEVIIPAEDNKSIRITKREGSTKLHIASPKSAEIDNSILMFWIDFSINSAIKDAFLSYCNINKVFYIPVERNSIYTFSKELSLKRSEMIEQMQSLLLEKNSKDIPNYLKKNASRYPEAIEDALKQAQDLTQLTKMDADVEYIALAKEIEREILHGDIIVSKNGEVEFAPNGNKRRAVPVHLSASFIKTISSIIFFLKHVVINGNILLIDEPEMNLHPNLQITFARVLAKISNAGIKIWMSTHSDYIISEINNLCLVGKLRNNENFSNVIKQLGYSEAQYLNKDRIQALYLNDKKTATQVKIENLEVKDTGIDIESIDETLFELNERTNELNELYYNLEE